MRRLITATSFLFLFSSALFAAPIYKWVDEKGVTHFGSEPPSQRNIESVSTKSFQPKLPEKTAQQAEADNATIDAKEQSTIDREVRKQVAEETAALKKYCTEARYNLSQLENNPRVLADVDGKPTRLTEEERQARISELQNSIKERCTTTRK